MILTAQGEPYRYPKSELPSELPKLWDLVHADFSARDSKVPFDRATIAQIRKEIDPRFVPLEITRVYRSSDGEEVTAVHHAVAWSIKDPHKEHQQRPVTWPSDPGHPNYAMEGSALFIEDILDGDKDTYEGLPGPFYPIDSGTLMVLKAKKRAMELEPDNPEELARQIINAEEEKKQKAKDAAKAEAHYRFDHEAKGWEDSAPVRKVSVPVKGSE